MRNTSKKQVVSQHHEILQYATEGISCTPFCKAERGEINDSLKWAEHEIKQALLLGYLSSLKSVQQSINKIKLAAAKQESNTVVSLNLKLERTHNPKRSFVSNNIKVWNAILQYQQLETENIENDDCKFISVFSGNSYHSGLQNGKLCY